MSSDDMSRAPYLLTSTTTGEMLAVVMLDDDGNVAVVPGTDVEVASISEQFAYHIISTENEYEAIDAE